MRTIRYRFPSYTGLAGIMPPRPAERQNARGGDMNTTKNLVAVAILAAVGLCIAAIYYAGEQLGAVVPGPSKIGLAPDGTVWVASHGGLHHFTGAGERKEKVALSALSRGAIISELLPLSDGTLVLAEAVPSAAYRCDIAARVCTSITAKVAASNAPTAHALMIAADEQRGRFYVSDNANHRLLLLDFDGKLLDVTAPRRLLYPNEPGRAFARHGVAGCPRPR